MKKMTCLMLTILMIYSANASAQVLIGGDADSNLHPGAILELQDTKGLLLPNVMLFKVSEFQLADTTTAVSAKGMIVYNTNSSMEGGQGEGAYIWDGKQWKFTAILGEVTTRVTGITINGGTTAVSGNQISFTATILPANATNTNVSWSIINGSGSGYITSDGVFTAGNSGDITVRATAMDGSGVYGEKQVSIVPATHLITSITISADGGATTLNAGSHLQLTATVKPDNASNKTPAWSITGADATATSTLVNQSGLVTGGGHGEVTVTASAQDGSGKSGTYNLTVVQSSGLGSVTGNEGTYDTYCYPNDVGCWMIQNSKEGTYSQTTYKVKTKGERGYYYEWADAAKKSGNQYTACPPGYTLPTDKQWEALGSYLSSASATAAEKGYWFNTDNRAGLYSSVSSWDKWNNYGYWWSADGNDHQYYTSITNTVKHLSIVKDLLSVSVRCIRN